ncbi:PadR family transcriptional regulator [Streptomyces sp. AJS327]|uniref:PadR family transcriptional regulator n=1 Tax=Streptomyces sp. AJS327 TaxID=2545265 RepID=UPI0035B50404
MEPAGGRDSARDVSKVESQLRKDVREFCVLAPLRDRLRYAVEPLGELGNSGALATGQGTVYPLLARLRGDALVATDRRESPSGPPPRRYYALTGTGRAALTECERIRPGFRDAVDQFLAPDERRDQDIGGTA